MTLQDTVFSIWPCFLECSTTKNTLQQNGTLLLCCVSTKNLLAQVLVGTQVSKILQEKIVFSRTF